MTSCWCYVCDETGKTDHPPQLGLFPSRMNLCPDCGNKRCPRAQWHRNKCTHSNEPGQRGSRYR